MKKILLLLTFTILPFYSTFAQDTLPGKVIKIHDGDTFTFKTSKDSIIRIRMKGIDAPELSQPYGIESRQYLLKYLNKKCRIITFNRDKYGRTIGVLLYSNSNINLNEVKSGNAWNYTSYNRNVKFSKAQDYAMKHKLGLWSTQNPIPPWIWRKSHTIPPNK